MNDLTVTRLFGTDWDHLWKAWTDPAVLATWWWPARFETEFRVDANIGGRFRYLTIDLPPMGTLDLSGTFLEVAEPKRLAYTWAWATDGGHESRVEVDIRGAGSSSCEVTIRHANLKDAEDVSNHIQGWNDCLDRLELLFPVR